MANEKVTITFTVEANHPKIRQLKARAASFPMSLNQLCKILFMGSVDPNQRLEPANPIEVGYSEQEMLGMFGSPTARFREENFMVSDAARESARNFLDDEEGIINANETNNRWPQ